MANYPTADPSFANKSANQTIASAHINAIQDEVVAIGSALRGTLQHGVTLSTSSLNVGGASSVNTLQVNGASTFTGNVTVSGTMTVGGAPVGTVLPAVKLRTTAATAVANGAFVGLNWDVQEENTHAMHSTSANSSRITFAHSTGGYMVGANVVFNAIVNQGIYTLFLRLNDSSGVACQRVSLTSTGAEYPLALSAYVRIGSTSDYITAVVHQNNGSTASIAAGSTLAPTMFWARRVSS